MKLIKDLGIVHRTGQTIFNIHRAKEAIYEIEESDVGTTLSNYMGQSHDSVKITEKHIGKQTHHYNFADYTCWHWHKIKENVEVKQNG